MRIVDGFILKNIADSYIVVPLRERLDSFSAVINLNEVGAFLWEQLQNDITKEKLVDKLTSSYDVDTLTAQKDVDTFINKLKDNKLLEE